MTLQHLRSSTANKRPDPTAMADGQIALNTAAASPGLFYKDSAGNLVKAGPVHVGSTAPNVSPASGGTAGNSTGESWLDTSGSNPLLKIWSGAAWQTVQPVASGTVVSTADTGSVTSTMIADGTIVNADVNASAAIAGTKISPDFGSQNVTTTGTVTGASLNPTSSTVPTNGVYLPAANSVAISTNGSGRLFVNSDGKIGVGNTVASSMVGNGITIGTGTSGQASVYTAYSNSDTYGALYFADTTAGAGRYAGGIEYQHSSDALILSTASSERLRITSAGLVGIGASSPGSLFSLSGSVSSNIGISLGGVADNITASRYIGICNSTNNTDLSAGSGFSGIEFGGPDSANEGYLAFHTHDKGVASGERLRIDKSGRIGIGSSNPQRKLVVSEGGAQGFEFFPGDGGGGNTLNHYNRSTSAFINITTNADQHIWARADGEKARLDSSGRLLVGTSSSASVGDSQYARLQVKGNNYSSSGNGILSLQSGTTTPAVNNALGTILFADNTGGEYGRIDCYADSASGTNDYPGRLVFSTTADGASSPTERMRIGQNGRINHFSSGDGIVTGVSAGAGTATTIFVGRRSATSTADGTDVFYVFSNGNVQNTNNSYGAISDIKLKENIVDAGSQWNDLKALQVRKYNFKEGQTHTQIGLVAQEVELVSPGLVSESPDRDENGNDLGTVTKSVNYSVLYMKAVKALQEAMERIEQLESEMAEVKAQLS